MMMMMMEIVEELKEEKDNMEGEMGSRQS